MSLDSGVSSEESVDEFAHAAESSSKSEDSGLEVCVFDHSYSIKPYA